MKINFINIYNNLIKLTRNKSLYKNKLTNDNFSNRLTIFFFHFAFFLKKYKNNSIDKNTLQDLYDFVFKQIELSLREIGYGDVTVNKKMKIFVNLLHAVIQKIDSWEKPNLTEKNKIFSYFVEIDKDLSFYVSYFNKFEDYLLKKSFNYFTKDVLSHKF